jgi:hypothetical protein
MPAAVLLLLLSASATATLATPTSTLASAFAAFASTFARTFAFTPTALATTFPPFTPTALATTTLPFATASLPCTPLGRGGSSSNGPVRVVDLALLSAALLPGRLLGLIIRKLKLLSAGLFVELARGITPFHLFKPRLRSGQKLRCDTPCE